MPNTPQQHRALNNLFEALQQYEEEFTFVDVERQQQIYELGRQRWAELLAVFPVVHPAPYTGESLFPIFDDSNRSLMEG